MAYILNHVFSVLFPPTCSGCGVIVAQLGTICPKCWKQLHFITKPYCPVMGTPFIYDPGDGFLSGEALQSPPPFAHARSAVVHNGLARSLVTRLKYGDRTDLAPFMASWMVIAGREMIDECDLIVPIPLHLKRFIRRTYNQAAELGRAIAQKSEKTFDPECLKRKRHTVPQVGLHFKEREQNVHNAFEVPLHQKNKIKGKNILLIDDVYTTGATVRAATKVFLKAGVARVDVLTFSRVLPDEVELPIS